MSKGNLRSGWIWVLAELLYRGLKLLLGRRRCRREKPKEEEKPENGEEE